MDAKPVPIRFRDPQIEMAHGAGGKASRKLVEGLFAPLLFGASPGPARRRGAGRHQWHPGRHHHRQFCRQAAEFSRRLDRRTGRERHGERSCGFGREGRGAGRHLCAGSGTSHLRPGSRSSRHGEGRAGGGRRASRPATPRWWSTARPTRCTSPPPALAACSMA